MGDKAFVKLVMTNWGLVQVVNYGNELAQPETADSRFANKTLANCIGLHKLFELRNEEQAKQLSSAGAGVGAPYLAMRSKVPPRYTGKTNMCQSAR